MSRSGYSDDLDQWDLIRWRGQVTSAIRGKRGQVFLRDLLEALDALPEKKLITGDLEDDSGAVCALGALGKKRGVDLQSLDTYDYVELGKTFNIAHQLAQEVMFENDDLWRHDSPERRWERVRGWVADQIRSAPASTGEPG